MFNERKAAQVAAFFLLKSPGRISHLKLMKLLYLAERESFARHGFPMIWDHLVSMPQGPVLSQTLDLMDGDVQSAEDGWESWISAKENNELSLRKIHISEEDLDELSQADLDILSSIWDRFGDMGKWNIKEYTHDHCAEWKDPKGSSRPIKIEDIFKAVGYDEKTSRKLAQRVKEEQELSKTFAAL